MHQCCYHGHSRVCFGVLQCVVWQRVVVCCSMCCNVSCSASTLHPWPDFRCVFARRVNECVLSGYGCVGRSMGSWMVEWLVVCVCACVDLLIKLSRIVSPVSVLYDFLPIQGISDSPSFHDVVINSSLNGVIHTRTRTLFLSHTPGERAPFYGLERTCTLSDSISSGAFICPSHYSCLAQVHTYMHTCTHTHTCAHLPLFLPCLGAHT